MHERQSRAVSTGSFHVLSEEPDQNLWRAFRELSGLDTVHPLRRELQERKAELSTNIEVMNARFWESLPATLPHQTNKLGRLTSIFRTFLAKASPQKSYLSLDIVDLYSDYQISLIGEEATGLPGVGMAESMACGCVYLGRRDLMYQALGMVEGVHYLAYEGGVDGLQSVLSEALKQPDRLNVISAAALELVETEWSKTAVIERLIGLAMDSVRS